MPFAADVLLHLFDAVDGNVELVVAGVLQVEEVPLDLAGGEVEQAAVAADAVVGVDHVIALAAARRGRRAAPRPAPWTPRAVDPLAEDLLLGDHRPLFVGQPEAGREGPQHQPDVAGGGLARGGRGIDREAKIVGGEQVGEALGLAAGWQTSRMRQCSARQSFSRAASAAIPCPSCEAAADIAVALGLEPEALALLLEVVEVAESRNGAGGGRPGLLPSPPWSRKSSPAAAKGSPRWRGAVASPVADIRAESGPPPVRPPADRRPPSGPPAA